MITLRFLLSPGYEPGDGTMDGAQPVDGQWWHPVFGCDSLQYVVDNARQVPDLGYLPPSWRISQRFVFTRLPPAPVAPPCTPQRGPMTFDPGTIKPPQEFHEGLDNANWSPWTRDTLAARWGAAQADDFVAGGLSPDGVELLRQVVESAPDTTP